MQAQIDLHQGRYQSIDEALKRHCDLPVRQYFVAAAADDGSPYTFVSGSHKLSDNVIAQFFDAGKFHHVMNRLDAGVKRVLDDSLRQDRLVFSRRVFSGGRPGDRRRSSAFADEASPVRCSRKQPKRRKPLSEAEDTQMTVSPRRCLRIADSDAVWNFYEQGFKKCQQNACKLIAKAWVKVVEPKKQSTHPYTGSDEKAPSWWPKPWGPTKDEKVRHKEPDHLYKRERVYLLAHILRLLLEPNSKQHPGIQKLGLNVTKLEEATAEALSSFFKSSDSNNRKRPFLTEIFNMARQEERYKLGEIDGSTEVCSISEDKLSPNYASKNSGTESLVKEDEDVEPAANLFATMGGIMRPMVHTDAAPWSDMHEPGDVYIGGLPTRPSRFQPPTTYGTRSTYSYLDNGVVQVHEQVGVLATGFTHDASHQSFVLSNLSSPEGTMYPSTMASPFQRRQQVAHERLCTTAAQHMEEAPLVPPVKLMTLSQPFITGPFGEAS